MQFFSSYLTKNAVLQRVIETTRSDLLAPIGGHFYWTNQI